MSSEAASVTLDFAQSLQSQASLHMMMRLVLHKGRDIKQAWKQVLEILVRASQLRALPPAVLLVVDSGTWWNAPASIVDAAQSIAPNIEDLSFHYFTLQERLVSILVCFKLGLKTYRSMQMILSMMPIRLSNE